MYYTEYIAYQSQTSIEESKALFERTLKKYGHESAHIRETGTTLDGKKAYRIQDSVSDRPSDCNSVYAMNDTFLELRTPFDERRGLLTLATACSVGVMIFGLALLMPTVWQDILSGTMGGEEPLPLSGYIAGIFMTIFGFGVLFVFLYFGHWIIRLELFVQRRLLVRFNRVTRKVYVHRPRYAGGIVELDWDKVLIDGIDPKATEAKSMGVPLVLFWFQVDTGLKTAQMIFTGRNARKSSDLVNLWEYIRRYMENGPQDIPAPKRIGKFPWPWRSVQAALSLVWPFFVMASLRWMIPLLILMSPAILIFAAGHWLSLLLCWEPVFPKAIRDACKETTLSVLQLRLIDLGAWSMLAGLVYFISRLAQ